MEHPAIHLKKKQLSLWLMILFTSAILCTPATISTIIAANIPEAPIPTITIIIDDVGNNQVLDYRTANLNSNVALSILPHTPYSEDIAKFGHQKGMDILLHQPMESLTNNQLLGPGALHKDMEKVQFKKILSNNLAQIPFVIGINNHMGSSLTADSEKMNWLMAELKPRNIFFIDSRTTTKTVAAAIAKEWKVPTLSRKVFLDHDDEPVEIEKQFNRLLKLAKKYGHATAIGHPRNNTLLFLEERLPNLNHSEVQLISVSKVMQPQLSTLKDLPDEEYDCYIQPMDIFELNKYCITY